MDKFYLHPLWQLTYLKSEIYVKILKNKKLIIVFSLQAEKKIYIYKRWQQLQYCPEARARATHEKLLKSTSKTHPHWNIWVGHF